MMHAKMIATRKVKVGSKTPTLSNLTPLVTSLLHSLPFGFVVENANDSRNSNVATVVR